jgi:serine/threonine protein kinase
MAKPLIESGAELDGFTVGERVHQGGMATLWTVTHPGINVPLLMKVPRVAEGEDPAAIVSFEMEQMIVPRLAGPHVPGCFGTGDFDRQPYVVMERIPGKTLYSRIDQLPIPYEEARVIGGQIATALADLHRQNVIHHDIKPSSIMFRPSGECVLIDFGLSHHNQLPDLLQEEFRLPYGTAPYMAPERLLGVRDDPRSDLFSLGVLLYFFTTGERPFGERARRCAACGEGCGAIPIRRAGSGAIIRHGCRKLCCGALRSSRCGVIRRLPNWRSNWRTPNRSS